MSYFSVLEQFSVLVRNPISAHRWTAQINACLPMYLRSVHSEWGRTSPSCHCTGSLGWRRCWEVKKHTSGAARHTPGREWSHGAVKNTHIYIYTPIHVCIEWHLLVHRRIQTNMVWLFAIIQPPFLSAISLLWSTEGSLKCQLVCSDTICV